MNECFSAYEMKKKLYTIFMEREVKKKNLFVPLNVLIILKLRVSLKYVHKK